jgi:serine/threonine protein kinase
MQAKIYLANDHDGQDICLKIFKRDQEVTEFQNSAEEEYRVSQLLRDHPNIVKIRSFHKLKQIEVEEREVTADYLIIDYCKNSDLFEFISKYSKR